MDVTVNGDHFEAATIPNDDASKNANVIGVVLIACALIRANAAVPYMYLTLGALQPM